MLDRAVMESFEALGLKPREGQAELCITILRDFLDGHETVMVDAPTGSGKSVISMVVAHAADRVLPGNAGSVVVSSTNALVSQYERDFERHDAVAVYGAERYPCKLREVITRKPATAAKCYRRSPFFQDSLEAESSCSDCRFRLSREGKASKPVVITNYSYFFIDRLYLATTVKPEDRNSFTPRGLYVMDEAHLIADRFAEHCAVHVTKRRIDEYLEDVRHVFGNASPVETAYTGAFSVLMENVGRSTIGPANAEKFMGTLLKFYGTMHKTFEIKSMNSEGESEHEHFFALKEKYRRLLCKVEDYFRYWHSECSVQCDEERLELTVKPVFPGTAWQALRGRRTLLLSATLDPDLTCEQLALDRSQVRFHRAPYAFNADDKRVHRLGGFSLSYRNQNDPATLDSLGTLIRAALGFHASESGIVICTSFAMAENIARRAGTSHRLFLHARGEPVDELVERFRRCDAPSLLISPSLFEGIDLAGDASKFQILVKAPFASLGDKRISLIMRRYPDAYRAMTIMRMVQGLGRSTRFRGDACRSYVMDGKAWELLTGPNNPWKSQFLVEH